MMYYSQADQLQANPTQASQLPAIEQSESPLFWRSAASLIGFLLLVALL
jgi:hypothetical protein